MADQKISQLSDGGASQAADEYVIARSGANYRIDGASVAAAATSVGTLTSLTVSGDLTVDTSTLKVDSTNNRVGVGTASPLAGTTLTVAGNSLAITGQNTDHSANSLRLGEEGSGVAQIRAYGPNASTKGSLQFRVSTSDGASVSDMTFDASGNLGLGVTPSAWGAGSQAMQNGGGAVFQYNNDRIFLGQNNYIDASFADKFIGNGYATRYRQYQGTHAFFVSTASNSSGAGASASFTQAMTLDASGNLLMGAASASSLAVFSGSAKGVVVQSAVPAIMVVDDGDTTNFRSYLGNSNGTMYVANVGNYPMLFLTNDTERARITSTGAVLVNSTTTGGKLYVYNPATNFETNTIKAHDANASTTSDGVLIAIADRNTTNNTFYALGYYNAGAAAFKFRVADSGDVTNTNGSYTAISDAKLKQDIIDAPSQWDDIKAVRFRKYRFKADVAENPDAPYLLGVVAQELEQTSPGCIDEHPDYEEQEVTDEDGNVTTERVKVGVTKSFKQSVLLMKAAVALQEAMARIEALEARLEALEA